MLTDVVGGDSNTSLIGELKLKEIKKLIAKEVIYGGMNAVKTCIEAVKRSESFGYY